MNWALFCSCALPLNSVILSSLNLLFCRNWQPDWAEVMTIILHFWLWGFEVLWGFFSFFEFLADCFILNFGSPYLIFRCYGRNREENKIQSVQSVSHYGKQLFLRVLWITRLPWLTFGKTNSDSYIPQLSILAYNWPGISEYHSWSLRTLYRRCKVSFFCLDVDLCFLLRRHGRHSSLSDYVSLLPGQIHSTHIWAFHLSGSCSMLLHGFLLAALRLSFLKPEGKGVPTLKPWALWQEFISFSLVLWVQYTFLRVLKRKKFFIILPVWPLKSFDTFLLGQICLCFLKHMLTLMCFLTQSI